MGQSWDIFSHDFPMEIPGQGPSCARRSMQQEMSEGRSILLRVQQGIGGPLKTFG
jgi:hypothetical protein